MLILCLWLAYVLCWGVVGLLRFSAGLCEFIVFALLSCIGWSGFCWFSTFVLYFGRFVVSCLVVRYFVLCVDVILICL